MWWTFCIKKMATFITFATIFVVAGTGISFWL